MKKWLIGLCCILVAGVVAFVLVTNNQNSRLDALNQDLGEFQSEVNALREKNESAEAEIQGLNQQVSDLTAERDQLTVERDQLAAENGRLTETLDGLNRNLSSSQQKLQSMMYILTDGAQGTIEGVLSGFMKIFEDVKPESAYFEAVGYVTGRGLMDPAGEETFGVSEKATLGELAVGLSRLQGLNLAPAEAAAGLLEAERLTAADTPAEEPAEDAVESAEEAAEASAEEPAEPASEAPAEEAVESAEEVTEEPTEPATETPAEEATEDAEEVTEAPAEEPAEPAAEAPAEEAAESAEEVTEAPAEEPAEPAAETPAEEATESAEEATEDETTLLTRDRLAELVEAFCKSQGGAVPAIELPASESADALRGDLAITLWKLAESR